MNEKLYELFDLVLQSNFSIKEENDKRTIELGDEGEHGKMETYSIFPGIILSYIDLNIETMDDVFIEEKIDSRLLEINHCRDGRYAYTINDDKIIYFGQGDLCISIYEITKTLSEFPLEYYRGLEIFIDVDIANDYVKNYIPDFDLIEFYEDLKRNKGFVLIRSNEKIDHVIGELYNVDERIKNPYHKLKTLELLLFFSITNFNRNKSISLSKEQVEIIDNVKNELLNDLESKITIDQLANKYDISKTSLKNCFKEIYGKPIYKWRKEYKLDYACKLLNQGDYTISEISKMVGYTSPSKFTEAFKDYKGCTPSEYKKIKFNI